MGYCVREYYRSYTYGANALEIASIGAKIKNHLNVWWRSHGIWCSTRNVL